MDEASPLQLDPKSQELCYVEELYLKEVCYELLTVAKESDYAQRLA
jgi:hypothetical protein